MNHDCNTRRAFVSDKKCHVQVEKLGGIDRLSLEFESGVTILAGENATNRSSLLRAVAAVLGGNDSAGRLKTDADRGEVALDVGSDTYTRTFEQVGSGVKTGGNSYCEAADLVDTYVAFFADNPIRQAVANEGDLRDLLMGPVDTAAIQERIETLRAEQRSLETDIERIREREKRLPELEEKRKQLTDEIDELVAEIHEHESTIDEFEAEETPQAESEATELREDVTELREQLREVENELETVTQRLNYREDEQEAAAEEYDAVVEELSTLDSEGLAAEIDALSREIDTLEQTRRDLQAAIEDLQSVVRVNERLIKGDIDIPELGDDSVTSALHPDSQTVECWTCGAETDQGSITDRLTTLRDLIGSQREELQETEDRIEELNSERNRLKKGRNRRQKLEERLSEVEEETRRHKERAAELQERREELREKADELESQIDSVEADIVALEPSEQLDEREAFVEANKELTQLERERGRLESQMAEVTDEIEEIEAEREHRQEYEAELAEVEEELERQRSRINDFETELTETMNEMMTDLLEVLNYENLARVWLERRPGDESAFALHIVREREDGAVYEDTVETLSESEREVVSLVVALAGYVVHDVAEQVPFLLLDSIEMIDGGRMSDLLSFIMERIGVDFLLVALLEKEARAVEDGELEAKHAIFDSTALNQ